MTGITLFALATQNGSSSVAVHSKTVDKHIRRNESKVSQWVRGFDRAALLATGQGHGFISNVLLLGRGRENTEDQHGTIEKHVVQVCRAERNL